MPVSRNPIKLLPDYYWNCRTVKNRDVYEVYGPGPTGPFVTADSTLERVIHRAARKLQKPQGPSTTR